jgi:hypothetical protein
VITLGKLKNCEVIMRHASNGQLCAKTDDANQYCAKLIYWKWVSMSKPSSDIRMQQGY